MKLAKLSIVIASLFGMQNLFSSSSIEMSNIQYALVSSGDEEAVDRENPTLIRSQGSTSCDERMCFRAMEIIVVAGIFGGSYYITSQPQPQSHPRIYSFDNQASVAVVAKCFDSCSGEPTHTQKIAAHTTANFSCYSLSPIRICSDYNTSVMCGGPTKKTNKHERFYQVTYIEPNVKNDHRGQFSLTPMHFMASLNQKNNSRDLKYLNYSEKSWRELEQL